MQMCILLVLAASWHGDNANYYADKGKNMTADMFETADDLIKVAKSIRMTAGLVYHAERAAVNISC